MSSKSSSVLLDGMRINYETTGQGVPVLLLHGWPETSYAWRKLSPLLGESYTVIAVDMPGFGTSSKPQTGYEKLTIAGQLARMMESLGHDRYFVVGHDMGGQVAYPLAATQRDKVAGLVFMESGLPGFGQENAMNVGTGGSWHFGFNMAGDISETLVSGKEVEFLTFLFYRDKIGVVSADSITDEDIAVYARALQRPGGLRSSFAYYRSLFADAEDNKKLGATPLEMPVLAVSADRGYLGGAERTMRQVADNVDAITIGESGHYIPEEQPEALADALKTFFGDRK